MLDQSLPYKHYTAYTDWLRPAGTTADGTEDGIKMEVPRALDLAVHHRDSLAVRGAFYEFYDGGSYFKLWYVAGR